MNRFSAICGLTLFAISLSACSSEPEPAAVAASEVPTTVVTADEALSTLQSVLDATGTTRSTARAFDAANLEVFTDGAATRADEEKALAYIVNFDGGGYAILGADTRQAPVVALIGKGTLTSAMLREADQNLNAGADATSLIRASIARYLKHKTTEAAPETTRAGIQPVIVKEFRDSLMLTSWSADEPLLENWSRTKIALAQMMVYNAEYERYYPTMIYGYVLRWSNIAPVATYRHLADADPFERFSFQDMLMMPLDEYLQNATSIEDICYMFTKSNAYSDATAITVDSEKVREMIYLREIPTFAQFTNLKGQGWVMDGWMKMQQGGIDYDLVHCKFANDLNGTDDGFYELSAIDRGIVLPQEMFYYSL